MILSSRGTYAVKEAYLHGQQGRFQTTGDLMRQEWKQLWHIRVQHRLKLLIWKIATNAMPIGRDGHLYLLCGETGETSEQLFLACPVSSSLWIAEPWPMSSAHFVGQSIQSWLKFLLHPPNLPISAQVSGGR